MYDAMRENEGVRVGIGHQVKRTPHNTYLPRFSLLMLPVVQDDIEEVDDAAVADALKEAEAALESQDGEEEEDPDIAASEEPPYESEG